MKKVVYTLAVLFSVALASCGGNKSEAQDSAAVVEEAVSVTEVVDSVAPAADSAVADSAAVV
ncbi:MAG: hypothetical protein K2J23_00635, partial [Muribaculaceae bacterium]|nr:hypothetical protein [Muribaculaceae bacterium]